jgi:hypothetical protein
MILAKIENMFLNGTAHRRRDIERECACAPNQIWRVGNWFCLVCNQSQNGPDFPVGERGLKRARKSLDARYVENAYIVFANNYDKEQPPVFIAHDTLGNVERTVRNVEPKLFRDDFGPCWFFNKDFQLVMFQGRDDYQM